MKKSILFSLSSIVGFVMLFTNINTMNLILVMQDSFILSKIEEVYGFNPSTLIRPNTTLKDSELITNLSIVAHNYFEAGSDNKSLTNFDKVLVLDQNNIAALIYSAKIFYDQTELDKASIFFNKVLAIDPRNIDALIGMGNIHYDKTEYDKVTIFFNKVLAIDPRNIDALIGMGDIHSDQGVYDEALEYLNQALAIIQLMVMLLTEKVMY